MTKTVSFWFAIVKHRTIEIINILAPTVCWTSTGTIKLFYSKFIWNQVYHIETIILPNLLSKLFSQLYLVGLQINFEPKGKRIFEFDDCSMLHGYRITTYTNVLNYYAIQSHSIAMYAVKYCNRKIVHVLVIETVSSIFIIMKSNVLTMLGCLCIVNYCNLYPYNVLHCLIKEWVLWNLYLFCVWAFRNQSMFDTSIGSNDLYIFEWLVFFRFDSLFSIYYSKKFNQNNIYRHFLLQFV